MSKLTEEGIAEFFGGGATEDEDTSPKGGGLGRWLKRLPATAKQVVGEDLENVAAFGGGAANAVLGGSAPEYLEGARRGGPFMGLLNAGVNLASGGKDLIDSRDTRTRFEERASENPIASGLGTIAGIIAPASGMAKAYQGAKAAGQAPQALQSLVSMAGRNAATRTATAGTVGAVEGAMQARSAGESTLGGAVTGGALSMLGHGVVAEMVAPAVRYASNSRAGQNAVERAGAMLRNVHGTDKIDADRLLARRAELGPEAALVDVDPAFRSLAKRMMYNSDNIEDARELTGMMNARIARYSAGTANVREAFSQEVLDTLPQRFMRNADDGAAARTSMQITSAIRQENAKLAPMFKDLFDNYDRYSVKVNEKYIDDGLVAAFSRNGQGMSDASEKGLKYMRQRMTTLKGEKGYLSPRDIQTLRLDLKEKYIEPMASDMAGNRSKIAPFIDAKAHLEDNYLDLLPGYKELNRKMANEFEWGRAYDLGRKVFTKQNDPDFLDDLPVLLDSFDVGSREGFLEGFTRGFSNSLETYAKQGKTMRTVTESPSFQNAIRTVLPAEQAENLIKAADTAAVMQDTAGSLVGGSQTMGRMAEAGSSDTRSAFNMATIMGAIVNKINPGAGVGTAAGVGAAKQEIAPNVGAIRHREAQSLTNMLTSQGEQADSWINDIVAGKISQGNAPKQSLLQMASEAMNNANPIMTGASGAAQQQLYQNRPSQVRGRNY